MVIERNHGARGGAKNAYHYRNILYEMPFFTILVMIIHLEFYENWSRESRNSLVANDWEPLKSYNEVPMYSL